MNVLVLGGNWFIGTAVCMQLLERGHAVRVLSHGGGEPEHSLAGRTNWTNATEKWRIF